MKAFVGCLLAIGVSANLFCQKNLVVNGSFENYTDCPYKVYGNTLNYAVGWDSLNFNQMLNIRSEQSYNKIPDPVKRGFCHPCYSEYDVVENKFKLNLSVPENTLGCQEAHTGESYAYIYTSREGVKNDIMLNFGNSRTTFKTFGLLKSELERDSLYYVEFHVSLVDKSGYGTNGVGLKFFETLERFERRNELTDKDKPDIFLEGYPCITDKKRWIKISGYYRAIGGEKYIVIGNFLNKEELKFEYSKNKKKYVDKHSAIVYFGGKYYLDTIQVYLVNSKSKQPY